MSTVQALMHKLVQIVDPVQVDGTEITSSTVGTVSGSRFTAARQLSIYNDARLALFSTLMNSVGKNELNEYVFGSLTKEEITFLTDGSDTSAVKPSGFISFVSAWYAGTPYYPVYLLPTSLMRDAVSSPLTYYSQTSNKFIFEIGQSFYSLGAAIPTTTSVMLSYYGITGWVLSDITGGSSTEVFASQLEPSLIEIASAIANEQSNAEVLALAKNLIGGK